MSLTAWLTLWTLNQQMHLFSHQTTPSHYPQISDNDHQSTHKLPHYSLASINHYCIHLHVLLINLFPQLPHSSTDHPSGVITHCVFAFCDIWTFAIIRKNIRKLRKSHRLHHHSQRFFAKFCRYPPHQYPPWTLQHLPSSAITWEGSHDYRSLCTCTNTSRLLIFIESTDDLCILKLTISTVSHT